MRVATSIDVPDELRPQYRRARLIQWITIAYLVSVVVVLYFVLGSSQAMRAAWMEDILSLIPSIVWVITAPIAWRKPNPNFPYGFHRAVSIGYLASALPLLALGIFLVVDSAMKLVQAAHPTMGSIVLAGQPVWIGWPALLALIYSAIPSMILGRMKLPLAKDLHDKPLYADANMRKADWLTAGAAMIGVIGIGFGFWWADSAAALVIGLDVLRDGFSQTKRSIGDLSDRRPMNIQGKEEDLPERVRDSLRDLDWVDDAQVRLREAGHVLYGEGFVVPTDERNLVSRIEEAAEGVLRLDWRLAEFVLTPVSVLDHAGDSDQQRNRQSPPAHANADAE